MAEYCIDCWIELFAGNDSPDEYVVTKDFDLCEGCGEYKHVVIAKKRDVYKYKLRYIILPFKFIGNIVYILWRLMILPYLLYKYFKKKNR